MNDYFKESRLIGRQKVYSARVRAVLEVLFSTPEDPVEFTAEEVDAIVQRNCWGETEDFIKQMVEDYA